MSGVIPIERGTSDEESQLNLKFWNNSYSLPRFIILDFLSSPRRKSGGFCRNDNRTLLLSSENTFN